MNKAGSSRIKKIVITGGPCAGKTTGMSWIQNTFEKNWYTMLFMQEPATELKTAGITPMRCSSMMSYQLFQMKLQLEKQRVFERAARDIANKDPGSRVLIIFDRGFFDNRAYMTEAEFEQALALLDVDREEMLLSYDAVFHLETTAKFAAAYYGTATNAIRDESPEEAAALDDRVINAWKEHPYFRVIENLNGFEDKMRHLIAEIASFLGDPAPFEIRRRLLIDKPDPSVLEAFPGCHRFEIEQVYLLAPPDEEIRVRMRRGANGVVYYLTRKKGPAGYRSLISEGRLSEREYQQFLGNADPSRQMICKTRYCLTWKQQYFEIDIYPFWDNRAVLEVSLREADDKITVPDFLHVQRDVSEDPCYEISYLAQKQVRESF